MSRLEGKVTFITAAARGQGRSHAVLLAEEGAAIIAVDIFSQIDTVPYAMATPEDLAQTVNEVEALDRRIVARRGRCPGLRRADRGARRRGRPTRPARHRGRRANRCRRAAPVRRTTGSPRDPRPSCSFPRC
jgi:hypothetical protein